MADPHTQLNAEGPCFDLFFPNAQNTEYVLVARLFDPHFDDMFWYSYRIEPISPEAETLLRDQHFWHADKFIIQLPASPAPPITDKSWTFPGRTIDYCMGNTDRLSFRSLAPFRRPTMPQRIAMWLIGIPILFILGIGLPIGYLIKWLFPSTSKKDDEP
jgi:hypothetical protein